ncbi:MAG: hypothetical protein Q7S80_00240 [bacterium]|nr:hypothetical protein [bacterium]
MENIGTNGEDVPEEWRQTPGQTSAQSEESLDNPAETERSREVASEKLRLLMADDFTGFATRFMNVAEYDSILKSGLVGGQVIVIDKQPFKTFMESSKRRGWVDTALLHTDWDFSVINMKNYQYIMQTLHQCREGKNREETLVAFRDRILESKDESMGRYAVGGGRFPILNEAAHFHENIDEIMSPAESVTASFSGEENEKIQRAVNGFISGQMSAKSAIEIIEKEVIRPQNKMIEAKYDESSSQGMTEEDHQQFEEWARNQREPHEALRDICELMRKIDGFGGKQILELLNNFINDPNFLREGNNLREVVNALAYDPRTVDEMSAEVKQYQVLGIFGLKTHHSGGLAPSWGRIDSFNPEDTEMLGAIAIMPNKELYQRMVEASSHAGQLAHPVFDSNGTVRFPARET